MYHLVLDGTEVPRYILHELADDEHMAKVRRLSASKDPDSTETIILSCSRGNRWPKRTSAPFFACFFGFPRPIKGGRSL